MSSELFQIGCKSEKWQLCYSYRLDVIVKLFWPHYISPPKFREWSIFHVIIFTGSRVVTVFIQTVFESNFGKCHDMSVPVIVTKCYKVVFFLGHLRTISRGGEIYHPHHYPNLLFLSLTWQGCTQNFKNLDIWTEFLPWICCR